MFPVLESSRFSNQDLFINRHKENWINMLKENHETYKKIQDNIKANLKRMLEFWKFDNINYTGLELNSLKSNKKNQVFSENGNHNDSRMTRVLHTLRLFGLHKEHKILLDVLKKYYPDHGSINFWKDTIKTLPLVDQN